MEALGVPDAPRTVTDWQSAGLNHPHALAASHASHALPTGVLDMLTSGLATTLTELEGEPYRSAEREFVSAFFGLAGQTPGPSTDLSLHYSTSVATDCVGRALRAQGVRTIGLITPTCDSIPALLRRSGLDLVPLSESRFWSQPEYRAEQYTRCDAVFLVIPNNPTGLEPDQSAMLRVVGEVADRNMSLVVDFCFRFYSRLHKWDQYATITGMRPDLNVIFLEDTGKTWPLGGLKVGFSCSTGRSRELMRESTREILLNVSPLTLRLLARLIRMEETARRQEGTDPHACRVVADNRRYLRLLLADTAVAVESRDSQLSVEWLRLPAADAADTCLWMESHGVSVLPEWPFHWHSGEIDNHIRVALARSPRYFAAAAEKLVGLLRTRYST